jgi:hypothetical protein
MDERHRIEQVHRFAISADKAGLRHSAEPSLLSGVSEETLQELRDGRLRQQSEAHAKLAALRKAANIAERALAGVTTYLVQGGGYARAGSDYYGRLGD